MFWHFCLSFMPLSSWSCCSVSSKFRLNFPEAVWSEMHPRNWFFAVLVVGTSDLCCAGPLHAQCKVEWYALFLFIYSLTEDVCLVFITNTKIFFFSQYYKICTKRLSRKTLYYRCRSNIKSCVLITFSIC